MSTRTQELRAAGRRGSKCSRAPARHSSCRDSPPSLPPLHSSTACCDPRASPSLSLHPLPLSLGAPNPQTTRPCATVCACVRACVCACVRGEGAAAAVCARTDAAEGSASVGGMLRERGQIGAVVHARQHTAHEEQQRLDTRHAPPAEHRPREAVPVRQLERRELRLAESEQLARTQRLSRKSQCLRRALGSV